MKKIIIFLFFIFCLIPVAVSAKSFSTIDIRERFIPGEEIVFTYSISDELGMAISVMPYLECEKDLPQPIPNEVEISLTAGKIHKGEYKGVLLTAEIPAQKCRAIIANSATTEILAEKEFFIDSKPALDISFYYCTDDTCAEEAKFFAIDSSVYIKYRSDYNPPVAAMIKSDENGISDTLVLPGYYKFKKAGEYFISYEIMGDGFQKIDEEKYLEVFEKMPVLICDNNGKCENEENIDNCQSDCLVIMEANENLFFQKYKKIIFFVLLLLFVMLIIISFLIFNNTKKNNNSI